MTNLIRVGTRCASTILLPVAAVLLAAGAATAQETAPAAGGVALDLDVIAKQLDIARQQIQPSLGATVYDFGRQAIETQPQGDNQPFNRLLLQAPGVTQDSFGQLHVRNEHANTQFRINGVQLPEGINVFGQALQTRLANSVALITGSLPAQYGLRTSGIIDIQTKTGTLDPGSSVTMYGGSQSTIYPSAEWGGRVGQIDYYVTGEYLQNALGIENPAPTFNAIHDNTQQTRGFAYVSGIIDPTSRLTAMLGVSRSQFQIPQVAGQTPGLGLTVDGISDFASAALNENQRQINHFGILAWQKHVGDFDFQVAGFTRAHHAQRLLYPARALAVQRYVKCPAGRRDRRANHRPADLDLRFEQQNRVDLQLLSARRMEDRPDRYPQFRRALRPVCRVRQRAPAQPTRQFGVAADGGYSTSCGLCALFHAAPLRARREHDSRALCQHDRRAGRHPGLCGQGGTSALL